MDVALLIVGGGPAAFAAARGYRDADGPRPVLMVADERRPPYRRPPLTKDYLRGESGEAALPLEPAVWYRRNQIDLAYSRVVHIDSGESRAWLEDGREVAFERLVLATGSAPARPPLPGADLPGVLVIRTLSDVHRLLRTIGAHRPVAVVGAGFIGCELAVSLRRRGHPVTIVDGAEVPQQERLGRAVGERIAQWLEAEGVKLVMGIPAKRVRALGDDSTVVEIDGHGAVADLTVLAAGARPRLELARDLDLDVSGGGIATDASMRTAIPNIYAAGDVALAEHPVVGRRLRTEHWGDALVQGEVAGRAAAGQDVRWSDVPGFWSTIGDRTLKQVAWGDGFDTVDVAERPGGGFAASYRRDGRLVGVVTHDADGDFDLGRETLAQG